MKRITVIIPTRYNVLGSIYWNQFLKLISVEDEFSFILFVGKTNWFIPKLIKRAMTEKSDLLCFNFWRKYLFPINTM